MGEFFVFLQDNPYVLLFGVVAAAAALGRLRFGNIGLGTTASAILIGASVSIAAASSGVTLQLDEFTKLFAYYLFMYAVGLRIGPSFINSFDRDGLRFAVIAVLASTAGLGLALLASRLLSLPAGMDVGLLAGALTESAAIGAAEGAVASGAAQLPEGMTAAQVSANAAVGYSLTYLVSSVTIIMLVRSLPRLFGRDAHAAAREYEATHKIVHENGADLHPAGQTHIRFVEITDPTRDGQLVDELNAQFAHCRILARWRDGNVLPILPESRLVVGDKLAIAGTPTDLVELIASVGREAAPESEQHRDIGKIELIVMRKEVVGRTLAELGEKYGYGVKLTSLKRGGQEQPWGPDTKLRRGDVLDLVGDRRMLDRLVEKVGREAKIDFTTDLLTLGFGIVLGLCVGMLTVNVAGIEFGLGSAASVLVAGVVIASIRQRIPIFGNTPVGARQLLEDIGLTVFVAVIGVNAGSHILDGVTPLLAMQIVACGLFVALIPPLLAWVVGLYVFKINAAVLMGVVSGARVNTAPVKEATNDLKSSVPWAGYPIPYAISNMLDSFWGYFLMVIR